MKLPRIFVFSLLFFLPALSHAEVYINEIMYDSPGADDDWVEIYNSGPDPVTIITGSGSGSWRFVDTSAHTFTLASGSNTLAPETYAVITNDTTRFSNDWTAFSGTLFKSSFSLTNTNNTISLKDGDGTVIEPAVSYSSTQGAKGDGNSLSRQADGTWLPVTPTPGLINSSVLLPTSTTTDEIATSTDQTGDDTPPTNEEPQNTSAHSSPAPLSNTENKIEFEISAGRDRLTSVGNSLVFNVSPTKLQNVSESGIIYYWSFGDGTVAQGKIVNHVYKFAGSYSVVVNANYSDKQAVSRIRANVISPNISIAKVPGGVEVSNNSDAEINLEGWNLVSERKTFVFPRDTLISKGKGIIFADDITGMPDDAITLTNPLNKGFGFIKKTEVGNNLATANDAVINLDDIQAKITEVKNTLAKISPGTKTGTSAPVVARIAEASHPKEIVLSAQTVGEELPQTENTALVFEAEKESGFVGRVFSWPIKGFNFIRRLFVEE